MNTDCSMPGDGATRSGSRLSRHLANCSPCRGSLDRLAAESHVVTQLAREPAQAPARFLDRVLSAAAREGRDVLADLVYQMVRSCIAELPVDTETPRHPLYDQPARLSELAQSATQLNKRLPAGSPVDSEFPSTTPAPSTAFDLATTCLKLLEQIEGPSARQRFMDGWAALLAGDNERAITVFEPMLSETLEEWLWPAVRWNMMCALLRANRPDAAAKVGEIALRTMPEDRMMIFNTAVAYADLENRDQFAMLADRFSQSTAPFSVHANREWWKSFINQEAHDLAVKLGDSVENIVSRFRLPTASGGST